MRKADRISSIIILCICGYFWYKSTGFTKFGSLFPQVVVAILGFLALLLVGLSFRKTDKTEETEQADVKYLNIVIAVPVIILWIFFIRLVGFAVSSMLFFSAITIIFEERKHPFLYYLKKVGIIVATVLFFYFFFSSLLRVPFPRGVLF
jgi:hypothetical protein